MVLGQPVPTSERVGTAIGLLAHRRLRYTRTPLRRPSTSAPRRAGLDRARPEGSAPRQPPCGAARPHANLASPSSPDS